VSLIHDLLKRYEPQVENISLIPSDGGRFEVLVNDVLVYSKLQTGRHAEPGEVVCLVENYLKKL
jgi:selenoprotein W-related protein